jgi:hypothetical protein
MPPKAEERLVAELAARPDEIAKAVGKLSPDEAAFFLAKLEAMMLKRKLQLTGYLVALVVWLLGMVGALVWYGTHQGFVGYAFLMPFILVGVTLYAFGRWANKIGKSVVPSDPSDRPAAAK